MRQLQYVFLFLILLGVQNLFAQGETRKVGSFQDVRAAEGIDVFLKHGSSTEVRVETSGNTNPSDIITEVSGTYLKIHVRDDVRIKNAHAKVYVTYESIGKISASSAANIYSQGPIRAKSLEVSCSSAASVEVELQVEDLQASVSSAGDVILKGRAREVEIDVSSAGEIDAYDLEADKVSVGASSGGSAKVNVVKELNANASSGGGIRFKGNPAKSRTDSSSGGSVKKSY
jgi:hypothetical protein